MNRRRTAAALTAIAVAGLLAACTTDEPAETSTPTAVETTSTPTEAESAAAQVVPDVDGVPASQAAAAVAELGVAVQFKNTTDGAEVAAADAAALPVVFAYPETGQPIGAGKLVVLYVNPSAAQPAPAFDLTTDEGLCGADAELTGLELNDALAPQLGFPADRDARTIEQDDAIRAYKNDAFNRACPERAS